MLTSGLRLSSDLNTCPATSNREDQCQTSLLKNRLSLEDGNKILNGLQHNDIYDHYELRIDDFQVSLA